MRAVAFLFVGLAMWSLIGCGSGSRPIPMRGEVTFDGRPVEEGTITLTPTDGHTGPGTGGTITNGRYEIPGNVGPTTGGKYRVEISGYAKLGKMVPDPFNPTGPQLPYKENYIPAKYGMQSTLVVEVPTNARELQQDYQLEKDKGAK